MKKNEIWCLSIIEILEQAYLSAQKILQHSPEARSDFEKWIYAYSGIIKKRSKQYGIQKAAR
jgi:hypothetical protein